MPRALCVLAGLALSTAALADDLYVLAGNANPSLIKLDPVTGGIIESHPVTGQEALFGGLAAGPGGVLFALDGYNDDFSDRLFSIDAASGAGTVIGATRFNWNFRSLCVDPVSGTLYGATDNALYSMDTTSGLATLVAPVTGTDLDQLTALAINASGQAFITDIGNTDLFSLNLQTGQATRIASIGESGNWFNDLAFDAAGVLHGVRNNGGVWIIDTATGALTSQFPGLLTGIVYVSTGSTCYPNCDNSTAPPTLNANDFQCFLNKFAANDSYANCDGSTASPVLNANDFQCFLNKYAAGCS
jgi:hypothetical protein